MARISLKINGKTRVVDAEPSTMLLYVLRNDLGMKGPKFGCGLSQCGACAVIIDGNVAPSCGVTVGQARSRAITTLEGIGSPARPHALQKALIDEQAGQCGYCLNGMIMSAKVLLDQNPKPTDRQIRQALAGNLCRCGSHPRIIRAVKRASGQMA